MAIQQIDTQGDAVVDDNVNARLLVGRDLQQIMPLGIDEATLAAARHKLALSYEPLHPDTASNLNTPGALLDSQGDSGAARPYYERALAMFEEFLGPDYPSTRTVRKNVPSFSSPFTHFFRRLFRF